MIKPTKADLYAEIERLKKCVEILEDELEKCQRKLPKYNDRGAGRKTIITESLISTVDNLRASGASYRDIMDKLKIGSGTVNQIVNRPRDN